RYTTAGTGDSGTVEAVGRDCTAEFQVTMDMGINGTGNHVGPSGVNDLWPGTLSGNDAPRRRMGMGRHLHITKQVTANAGYHAILDAQIGLVLIACGDNGTTPDNGIHGCILSKERLQRESLEGPIPGVVDSLLD